MTAALTTLNISVEQIEHDLRQGRTVQEIAQDWSEPATNVLAVKRAMDARGESSAAPSRPPAAPAAGARGGLASVPSSSTSSVQGAPASSGLSVDALVSAAARSESKRTRQLGVKLHELAADLRSRLAEERRAAEEAEAAKAEQEKARAEVERLEAQLREARARLSRRGGSGSVRPPREKKPLSEAQRANLARAQAAQMGEFPCSKCGRVTKSKAGLKAHERRCSGGGP